MNNLKFLWFILPVSAWIGCHWVWTEAGKHIGAVPSGDGIWWAMNCIFVTMASFGLLILAFSKQE